MRLRPLAVVLAAFALGGCFDFHDGLALGQSESPPPSESFGGGDGCGGVSRPGLQSDPVVAPAKRPPPISGGTMTILQDGTVVAADPDRDQVHFYSVSRGVWHQPLPEGSEPGRVVEGPRGQLFVALRARSQVAMLDPVSGGFTLQRACASPRGMAYDAARNLLFVACATGELAKIEFGEKVWTTTVSRPAPDLRDLLLRDGHLWATSFRSAQLWDLDPATMTAQPLAGPLPVSAGATLQPRVAWRTVRSSGGVTMVHQAEQVEPVAAPGVCSGSYGAPVEGVSAPTMETVITNLDGATAQPQASFFAPLPVDVAVAGDGRVAVASAAGNQVFLFTGGQMLPLSIAGQPISLAFEPDGELWVFSREPAAFTVLDPAGSTVRTLPLSELSAFSTGHELFHRATSNAIACASCHPEAGDDGHVWALPEGTFRTPSLRGGLKGTEPFHWGGEEADMPNLISDIFVARMNGAPQTAERTGALLDWLDALPPRAASSDLELEAVARGARQFELAGCTACHAGRLGTNNATVDVGTGRAFQVPRLTELAYRAPFLHDGSAATLADRFTAAGGSRHGDVSALSAAQLADLIAYLESR